MSNEKEITKSTEETMKMGSETSDSKELYEEPESYGMMSRIIGVFIEPSKAFKRIAEKPEIWGPIIFIFVILLIASFLTMSKNVDLAIQTSSEMLSDRGASAEEIDQASNLAAIMARFQSVTQTIVVVIGWLLFSLLVFIIGLIMGQEASYKSSLSVVGYSSLPGILIKSGIIGTILMMTRDWSSMADYQSAAMKSSLSLYSLFGNSDMNAHLQAFLVMIDPFLIWAMILMAIGLRWANKTKMSNAWTATIISYVIFIAAMIPITAMGIARLSGGN